MEPTLIPDELTLGLVVTAEKDCGREDALETLHDPVVPLTVLEEVEKVEHLGGSVKPLNAAALTDRERCYPDWNEAVLAEGQSELRMTEDPKEEFSIASRVDQLVRERAAEGEPAEHKGAGVKSELLLAAFALFTGELDGFDLSQPALADGEGRQRWRQGLISPVSHTTCGRR